MVCDTLFIVPLGLSAFAQTPAVAMVISAVPPVTSRCKLNVNQNVCEFVS